jgi:hypothetical protein
MKGFVVRERPRTGEQTSQSAGLRSFTGETPSLYFLLGPTASFTESVRQELLGRGYSLLSDRFVPVWSLVRQLAHLLQVI